MVKYNTAYLVIDEIDSPRNIEMLEFEWLNFFIDNIYVEFGGRVYQQTVAMSIAQQDTLLLKSPEFS